MVKLKYPKNIWTKVLILVVLILIFLVHIDIKLREEENLNMEKFYIQYCIDYPFAVLNIQYQDSIFRVVVKDEVYSLKEKYQDKLQNALTKNDVLSIDSITYSELKTLSRILCKWKQDSVVSLFLYLDSVFKNKHKLIHNQAPVMNRLCPFLLNLHK